jgi:uncharacterized protein
MDKPAQVIDRDTEWSHLTRFTTGAHTSAPLRIGIMSGRRRHGKSFLLRALTRQAGGLYVMAVQEDGRRGALERFTRAVAGYAGLPRQALRLDDWEEVLRTALSVVARREGAAPLLVIDEFPYLLQHSPELPGLIQRLYDDAQFGEAGAPGGALILCGSAMSVMHELLSGTKPLRGRAMLDLRLEAFDHRGARAFWGIGDPHTAFLVHAVLGGAPGYRALTDTASPQNPEEFGEWVREVLLTPQLATYSRTETEYLLREDPRITHRTLYYEILSAVANGASTPTKIGGLLGRDRSAVNHPLEVLESGGYVRREQDLLKQRTPVISLPDPVIRFNQLVTLPHIDLVEEGLSEQAWQAAAASFHSKILGPHFEELSRVWTRTHARTEVPGLEIGTVGTTEVPDPGARTKHEVDVLALAPGQQPRVPRARIAVIGEAKATVTPRGPADLQRLEHIRGLLTAQGHQADGAVLALYSLHGFWPDLLEVAARRRDVLLVDVAALYGDGVAAEQRRP